MMEFAKVFLYLRTFRLVHRNKRYEKRIVAERVRILFNLAYKRAMEGDEKLAKRYTDLILKLSEKYNYCIPAHMKWFICKKCHTFLIPGKTSQVRLKKGKIVIKCLRCGNYKRYHYK